MWTAPDSGLHQTQTSEQYPKGETRRQDLNSAETSPLGSFFIMLAIVFLLHSHFIYTFYLFFSFSIFSALIFFHICYLTLFLEYSTVPFFFPFFPIFVTFTMFSLPIFLY